MRHLNTIKPHLHGCFIKYPIGFAPWQRCKRRNCTIKCVCGMEASWLHRIRFEVNTRHQAYFARKIMYHMISYHSFRKHIFQPIPIIALLHVHYYNHHTQSVDSRLLPSFVQFRSFSLNQRYRMRKMNQTYLNMQFTLRRLFFVVFHSRACLHVASVFVAAVCVDLFY